MRKFIVPLIFIAAYVLFVVLSKSYNQESGKLAVDRLVDFSNQMLLLLPFAFLLIGLFEVWIKKETVAKYLGHRTGLSAYMLAILLAGTTVGGIYVAFPFAYSLYNKGAKLGVIFTYVTAAGICRVPMTLFEASFLGVRFTLIRFAVSLPLVLLMSWLLGSYLQKRNYELKRPAIRDE